MFITYLGHSCFKIQDKTGADGITIVTDPFEGKSVGLRAPSLEADIVTVSHEHADHNNRGAIRNGGFVIDTPGEYDVKGITITGVDSDHDDVEGVERGKNTIFRFEVDDVSVVHLGDLGAALNNKQLEELVGTDILIVPVGGKYTLDAKRAVNVIQQIEPRIVIPMHYKVEGVTIDIEGVEKFIKEISLAPQHMDKLKMSKRDLPQEEMQLVILSI